MKKLLSRWIAAIMVSVMVISSGVTGTVQAEGNHVETTEEKLQTDTEKNNSEIEGDLSVGDDATSQKEDDSMTEENSVTESEVIKEGAVNEENVGKNPESTEVSEDTEPEESEEIEMALNYLYINEAEQQEGEQQSIVLSWGNENTQVNNISLTLENENGEQTILEATKKSDELYLYEHIFSQGVYHVSNVHVATDESEKDFTAEELEIDAYFGVGKTPNESAKSSYIEMESVEEGEDSANTAASVETSVVSIGENGEETAEASIGAAMEAQGVTARSGKARSARAKNVVVVLDPGHDSKHAGASGNSVHEEVATLKIAKYCKEELEQYGGITVYMTRESAACPFPNSKDNIDDIKQRTAWAKTKGADVFVSFHLNSNNSSSPNGAEVYYPKTSSGGAALAQKIRGELVALGLKNRGTKANETLAVINSSMRNGFPGVLIEHAFVSNSSDANNYLNSDAKLKKLGVADAKGIASYFGLSKGKWVQDSKGWKYEVNGKYVISQWMTIGGEKYYFDAEGYRVIGWQTIRSQKYYFMPDGHMHTGWLSFGDTYYYLNKEGIRQTGWQTIEGQKYYFMPDGHMHAGWLSFGDTYYYMMPDGHMHTGWLSFGDTYYYLNKEGIRQTGWQTIEDQRYYFMPDAHMHIGWLSFGDTYYYMMPDGHMHTGWLSFGNTYYYMDNDGVRVTGWQTIDGKDYYFDLNGVRKDGYPIEGKSEVTISQMLKMYQKQNKLYPSQALAKGGAPTIEDFVNIVYQEASAEGIKAEVVFCQSMLETGWLQFGGDVKVEQFNFAGLGATGGGVAGADFSSYGKEGVRIGIRAQVQHLKCYANKKPLINPCVDPRWGEWLRGKAPYVEWLGIKENPYGTGWAAGANYGNNIVKLIKSTKLL